MTPAPSAKDAPTDDELPDPLRRRLRDWIDVDEVGVAGLWRWLESVLPLLPKPTGASARPGDAPSGRRIRELAKDLVDCAQDRARLTVDCDRYFRDNQLLARRVKALEATVRTFERGRPPAGRPPSDEAADVAERYLPRR